MACLLGFSELGISRVQAQIRAFRPRTPPGKFWLLPCVSSSDLGTNLAAEGSARPGLVSGVPLGSMATVVSVSNPMLCSSRLPSCCRQGVQCEVDPPHGTKGLLDTPLTHQPGPHSLCERSLRVRGVALPGCSDVDVAQCSAGPFPTRTMGATQDPKPYPPSQSRTL